MYSKDFPSMWFSGVFFFRAQNQISERPPLCVVAWNSSCVEGSGWSFSCIQDLANENCLEIRCISMHVRCVAKRNAYILSHAGTWFIIFTFYEFMVFAINGSNISTRFSITKTLFIKTESSFHDICIHKMVSGIKLVRGKYW